MSNYTLVTNFLSKDSLISGNPLKAVKGADLTTEFTAVQSALNSKFDGAVVFSPDGTAAQPSLGFASSAGTGLFNLAGVLGFATGGVNRFSLSTAGGLFAQGVTGGDQGVGTINAAGLFVNGVSVSGSSGTSVVASKSTNTTRATTTTLTADPALIATLAAGVYTIAMYLMPLAAAGGGGGFKFNFSNTGSMSGNYAYTGGIVGAFVDAVGQSGLTGVTAFAANATTSVDWIQVTGTVTVLTPGVLSFQWAQNSSSAVNTVLASGSWMQCVKVG